MARLALAAHDPGGAAVLVAVAAVLRARGHDLAWLPSGPATRLWREAGETVPEAMDGTAAAAALAVSRPALLLTGTSFHAGFERALWAAARRLRVPSFAAVDSWTNIERRFALSGGEPEQPDGFGVPDESTRAEIAAAGWCRARLAVIGQPHLAARTERLKQRRRLRLPDRETTIVFFSEPIIEDFGPSVRGFTQFEVATLAAEGLAGRAGVFLSIKPHPRESEGAWHDWLVRTPNAGLATEDTETLLGAADGVLGMTTMVLLEARLAGIPVMSLQPDRPALVSPIIDSLMTVIAQRQAASAALMAWLAAFDVPPPPLPPRAEELIAGGGARFVAAVEEILARPGGRA